MAKVGKWSGSTKCSFCGKAQEQVAKLVAGPGVYICNECVGLCNDIMDIEADRPAPEEQDRRVSLRVLGAGLQRPTRRPTGRAHRRRAWSWPQVPPHVFGSCVTPESTPTSW